MHLISISQSLQMTIKGIMYIEVNIQSKKYKYFYLLQNEHNIIDHLVIYNKLNIHNENNK